MKHYLKRKMFLLSFCISLSLIFYQCQEDETTTIEQTEATELHTHTVSDKHLLDIDPEDVEAILNQVAAEGRGFIPKKEKGVSDDNRNVENPFGTVASDQVAGLEDLLGNKTYTFKIDAYNSQEGIFYNLIVHTDAFGGIQRIYVKAYETYNNTSVGPDYDGKVSRYDLDGYLESEVVFVQGKATVPSCADCEDITNDNTSDDNNDSGNHDDGDTGNNHDDPIDEDNNTGSGGPDGPGPSPGPSGDISPPQTCTVETQLFVCCNNNISLHGAKVCGCTPATGTYYITYVSCDHRAPDPDLDGAPIPCCDQDVVVIDILDILRTNLIETLELNIDQQIWLDNFDQNQLEEIIAFLDENENSEEAIRAIEITINVDQQFGLGSPYSDEFVDAVNCCGNSPILIINPLAGVKYYQYVRQEVAIIKQSEFPENHDFTTWELTKIYWRANKAAVQLGLDVIGLIPVFGEVADLANATIYGISGDGVNATLSVVSAIPIAGWFSTGVKWAKKTITLANGKKTTLKWIVTVNGIIEFGNRSQLAKVIGTVGTGLHAHHIIPWFLRQHDVIQKAAKADVPFHLNSTLNGIPLQSTDHLTGHNLYNNVVNGILNDFNILNPNASIEQSYEFVSDLIDHLDELITINSGFNLGEISTLINFP